MAFQQDLNMTLNEMNYPQILAEKERVEVALLHTKSCFQKKDYQRYLGRINKELREYERNVGL